MELLGYVGSFPRRSIWRGPSQPYSGPCRFSLDLATGEVLLADKKWGVAPTLISVPGRRFCSRFTFSAGNGGVRTRMTGHYIPMADKRVVDETYYNGDDYLDHEAQSAEEHRQVLQLLKRHQAQEPVLEIGCATGGLLAALEAEGFQAYGVDMSEWAIAKAAERVGL